MLQIWGPGAHSAAYLRSMKGNCLITGRCDKQHKYKIPHAEAAQAARIAPRVPAPGTAWRAPAGASAQPARSGAPTPGWPPISCGRCRASWVLPPGGNRQAPPVSGQRLRLRCSGSGCSAYGSLELLDRCSMRRGGDPVRCTRCKWRLEDRAVRLSGPAKRPAPRVFAQRAWGHTGARRSRRDRAGTRGRFAATCLLNEVVDDGAREGRHGTAVCVCHCLGAGRAKGFAHGRGDVFERAHGVVHHAQHPLLGTGRDLLHHSNLSVWILWPGQATVGSGKAIAWARTGVERLCGSAKPDAA